MKDFFLIPYLSYLSLDIFIFVRILTFVIAACSADHLGFHMIPYSADPSADRLYS